MYEKQYDRLYGLDVLKLICTFLVIYIHAGENTGLLNTISIVAVPIFFIISGVLYESVVLPGGEKKKQKQIVRLLKLFGIAFAFYSVWSGIICPLINSSSIKASLIEQFSVVPIIKLILLNAPTYGYHLWYISALLYVLILVPIVDSHLSENREKVMCFILMGIGVIVPWVCNFLDIPFRNELVRNFLFEGIPLFYIGRWLIKGDSSLRFIDENRRKSAIALMGIVIFCLLIAEERLYRLVHISTPVTAAAFISAAYLVWISIRINKSWCKNKYFIAFANAGGFMTTSVYLSTCGCFRL